MSNTGLVIGVMSGVSTDGNERPFLYNGKELTSLELLPWADRGQPRAITKNSPHYIVGFCHNTVTGPQRAVMWDTSGKITDLKIPFEDNRANSINNLNQLCGWMGDSLQTSHAFIKEADGTVVDLGLLDNGRSTQAIGMNNACQVAGSGINFLPGGGTTTRAFYWKDGQFKVIEPLPGFDRSGATDINDDGIVIGVCTSLSDATAFLWRNGITLDLHDLFPASSGLTIGTPSAINNAGQITGTGAFEGQTVAFRLTPVPGKLGDVNCDNLVNVDDLLDLIGQWGPCVGGPDPCHWADLNHDNTINHTDLFITLNNWGK